MKVISMSGVSAALKNKQLMQSTQVVCWCYTAFYGIDKCVVPDELCKYRIEGREICPATQRPHIQGYVMFKQRKRLSELKKIHSTAQWKKVNGSPWQNKVYCSKDGSFSEIGEVPKEPKEKDETWREVLACETYEEAIAMVREKRPRDYCLHGEAIERNLKRSKKKAYTAKYALGEFTHEPIVLSKACLFVGPTLTGKTQFAMAHFKSPLFVRHIDQLKTFGPENDGIVFDDMSFKHWPAEAVIHLLDAECPSEINIRYATASIPAGTKKIFTHNDRNPFYLATIPEAQQEAIERRLNRVVFLNKVY